MKTISAILVMCFVSACVFGRGLSSVDTVAKTLYAEARGEGDEGLRAVATVLCNRSIKAYGKVSIAFCAKEARKPFQFSCWNGKSDIKTRENSSWQTCLKIAKEIEAGTFQRIHGHTHYYAFKVCAPKWAKGKKSVVIGNHRFLSV